MTAHRRPAIAFSDAPRGTCRWCGEAIVHAEGDRKGEPNLRRRWHPECVEAYNATDPREARRVVRKRDRGICAHCALDTNALKREVRGKGRTQKLRERGFVPRRSLWELDHIVPLIDGGTHALENLQTLCTPCHKTKTADEARLRARATQAETNAAGAQEAAPEAAPDTGSGDRAPEIGAAPGRRSSARSGARAADLSGLLEHADAVNARIEWLLAQFP